MEAPAIEKKASFQELHYVDRDIQSRRKEWDIFSTLLMMLDPSECLENKIHGPIECHEYKQCMFFDKYSDCDKLCNKKSQPGKSHFSQFCNMSASASSTASASANSNVDSYNGGTTPGGFISDGSYSVGFQFWMVAVAMSIGMAIAAVHIGQRREDLNNEDKSLLGAEVRGSVGRRAVVVSGLMDGVLGQKNVPKQVELAEYALEPARTDSYESAMV